MCKDTYERTNQVPEFPRVQKEDMTNQNVRQYRDPRDPEKMAMDIRNRQNNPTERLEYGFTCEQAQA